MKFSSYRYIGFRYRQHRRKTSEKLVVETVYGPVRGVKRISCWDDPYYSFERIPYAKPPVGELRFAVSKLVLDILMHYSLSMRILIFIH